jgi:hypothetical protein
MITERVPTAEKCCLDTLVARTSPGAREKETVLASPGIVRALTPRSRILLSPSD